MTGDVTRRQPAERPEERQVDLWALPEVTDLEVRHASYPEPLRRYVTAREVAEYGEAIEFEVRTSAELPVRAYPPVLYVGDVMVHDFEQLDRDRYVFRSFEPEALPDGAPIALGWPPAAGPRGVARRRATGFRYEPPAKPRGTGRRS